MSAAASLHFRPLGYRLLYVSLLLVSILVGPGGHAESAEKITVLTHNSASFLEIRNGTLRGIDHSGRRAFLFELVRTMLLNMGDTTSIVNVPFARGIHAARYQDNVAFFHIAKIPERLEHFQWVGPIFSNRVDIYTLRSNLNSPEKREDINPMDHFCLVRHTHHKRYTDTMGVTNLTLSNSYESCVRMLIAGRVSYTPISDHDFNGVIRSLGRETLSKLKRTNLVLSRFDGYIALSKNIPKRTVERWQAALDKLTASEQYTDLKRRYLKK